jgi:hypothetical protein
MDHAENSVNFYVDVFTDSLPNNGRPIVCGSPGNAFADTLPSNGSTCHFIFWRNYGEDIF